MTVPSLDHLLTQTLSHRRSTKSADDQGGYTNTFSEIATVNGRINPASPQEMQLAGRDQADVDHAIYLPVGTDVRINDQFIYSGRTFEVKVPNITPSVPVYQKALCKEVQRV